MHDAVIISAARTPIGKFLGGLSAFSSPQLGALAIAEAVKRAGVAPEAVGEVIMGNVITAGIGQAPARQAALGSGLPGKVSALTVNKVCGSGLKAVMLAAQAVKLGDETLVVAGGMESMSNAPHVLHRGRTGWKLGNQPLTDALLHDGLVCAFGNCHMGDYAEHVAATEGVTRQEQDALSAESQQRAAKAIKSGLFREEIVPVTPPRADKPVTDDEGPRPDTTADGLAKLKPVFKPDGTVTAGNASTLSDGAAAVVVTSLENAEKLGRKPLARIVGYATAGGEPRDLFIAPAFAIVKVLEKTGLTVGDIDLFEINEAFASQMLATMKRSGVPHDRTNIHGGAIALGHPIGASGARVLVTLLHAMKRNSAKRGLAALCLGGGNAVAMVVEAMP